VIQTVALLLPVAGLTYSFGRVGKRIGEGAWAWSEDGPIRRAVVVVAAVSLAGSGGYVLLPNGEYRPIQRNERGTIQGGIAQLAAIPSGRPALTREREEQLGEIVEERDQPAGSDVEEEENTTTEPSGTATTGTDTATEPTTTETSPTATEETDTATTVTETTTETTTTTTETTP
jgi:hypothetical protein